MIKKIIPLLPLRDIVVFPGMVAPLFVGRKLSVNALNHVMTDDKKIFLVTQKDSDVENPNIDNLYQSGTIAKVLAIDLEKATSVGEMYSAFGTYMFDRKTGLLRG